MELLFTGCKKMKINLIIISAFLSVLASCGGGGSDSSNPPSTGTFVDSPVINIGYRTETQNGVTNSRGEFKYFLGETVTFFIGDIEFPSALAAEVVTPLDLADTDNPFDPMVINIIRLLQTLDKDGDPSNGITITDAARTNAVAIDFDISIEDFEFVVFINIDLLNAGQDNEILELFDVEIVLDHFISELEDIDLPEFGPIPEMDSLIFGTWIRENSSNDDFTLLSFFDDFTYIHGEIDNSDPMAIAGMEWGAFVRDFIDRTTTTQVLDNNGSAGLSDFTDQQAPNLRLLNSRFDEDTLIVSIDSDGDNFSDESISFVRIVSEGILGTWVSTTTPAELLTISFFDDNTYFFAEIDRDDPELMSGMELGTYAHDESTGLLTVTQTFDNNGSAGLTDFVGIGAPHVFADVSADTLTVTIDEDGDTQIDETIVFQRQ
jgi:hypothetical protein